MTTKSEDAELAEMLDWLAQLRTTELTPPGGTIMRSDFWTDWQKMEAERRNFIKLLRSKKPLTRQQRTALARQLEHCTPVPEFRRDRKGESG